MRHWHHPGRRGRGHGRGRRFGPWSWEGRFFERGELPLALLSLLDDGPKHGYELMKLLEERSGGLYEASAGSVYPTLQQLQDQDLVTSEETEGGKRTYTLTKAGKAQLAEQAEAAESIWKRAEDDEWTGWGDALHHDAAEIMRPAFRLMRTAVKSIARSRDPERADRVREILRNARQEICALDAKEA